MCSDDGTADQEITATGIPYSIIINIVGLICDFNDISLNLMIRAYQLNVLTSRMWVYFCWNNDIDTVHFWLKQMITVIIISYKMTN